MWYFQNPLQLKIIILPYNNLKVNSDKLTFFKTYLNLSSIKDGFKIFRFFGTFFSTHIKYFLLKFHDKKVESFSFEKFDVAEKGWVIF